MGEGAFRNKYGAERLVEAKGGLEVLEALDEEGVVLSAAGGRGEVASLLHGGMLESLDGLNLG